jgi:GH35 family endo-1,4-beta-xylanase
MKPCLSVLALLFSAANLAAGEILAEADAGIEKHRTGECLVRVLKPDGEPLPEGTKVLIEQTRHRFLFGATLFRLGRCRTPREEAAYEKHFSALFNFATLPFYWWIYEPDRDQPSYEETARMLEWCRRNDIVPKGHPLAWNFRDPPWLPPDWDEAMKLQLERVAKIVSRFEGEIRFWDVVNEATDYDRPETAAQSPILTGAIRRLGVEEYFRAAFRLARITDPGALLVINDYRNGEDYVARVITQLVDEEHRPLYDAIGIQSHQHTGAWTEEKTWEICERFARFGKPLHFTEVTFLSGEPGWEMKKKDPDFTWRSTREGERRQAEEVERFYTILFSHRAVEAITWWDFSDQGAWQGAPAGLLRDDMSPKPAYDILKKLIRERWWTRTEVSVDKGGTARFRGFFGDYRLTFVENGREMTGSFAFDKAAPGPVDVRLR